MSTLHKREPQRPFAYPDRPEWRPPQLANGTPKPIPLPNHRKAPAIIDVGTPVPALGEPNTTRLGIVPRTAVMQAVARIEAERAGGTSRQLVRAPAVTMSAPARWDEYRELGLTAPSAAATKAAKVVVSTYRLIGFAILTLIVIVLVGYIATTAFYFFNKTWVVPTVVSASDEKVVQLQSELAQQQNTRDKIASDLDD